MDVGGRIHGHEERVVVDTILPTVDVREHSNVLPGVVRKCDVEVVGGHEVKVPRVP